MAPEVIAEVVEETDTISIAQLKQSYDQTKNNASNAMSTLAGNFTLEGMDGVNTLVADAMKQIESFVANGEQKSFISKATSKALAVIDPNAKWAAKWLDHSKDSIKEEKFKEMSINEVVDQLVTQIMEKRKEVIDLIGKAIEIKKTMLLDSEEYRTLLTETTKTLDQLKDENSIEAFDGRLLATMLRASIQNIESDISSQVNPLIASARISCDQIATTLPTIENDLRYKAGFKSFQQTLSDLNGIFRTTTQLASNAGDIIRKDINDTTCEAMELLAENGLDTDHMAKIETERKEHQKKLNAAMETTQQKMNNAFNTVKQMHIEYEQTKKEEANKLLTIYSKVDEKETR